MVLMAVLSTLLVGGVALSVWWGSISFRSGPPVFLGRPAPLSVIRGRYGRALAIGIVGGFWAGALVTGPAIRLIMRLLAVTSGPSAQGLRTESEAIIGDITLDGTIFLVIAGGVIPALGSGVIYVIVHSLLPAGHLGGVVFGLMHFVLFATLFEPLRPHNLDFDLTRPNWLAILTFALTSVLHGMAVSSYANRYSQLLPSDPDGDDFLRVGLPLAAPAILLTFSIIGAALAGVGLLVVLALSRIRLSITPTRSKRIRRSAQIAFVLVACIALPGTVADLANIADRGAAFSPVAGTSGR